MTPHEQPDVLYGDYGADVLVGGPSEGPNNGNFSLSCLGGLFSGNGNTKERPATRKIALSPVARPHAASRLF